MADEQEVQIIQNVNVPDVANVNEVPVFKWDKQRMGTGIQITEGDSRIFLREKAFIFRTAIATYGFEKGIGYWEIEADDRTEFELKIGVSTCRNYNKDAAFCDFEFGWAYYGLAQLRHNSFASGPAFGKRFKNKGVLGVCLNMNNGTLEFSLNGELMGTAYQDEKLKLGPIYPAVSLLHCAGCRLITGKPVPQIFSTKLNRKMADEQEVQIIQNVNAPDVANVNEVPVFKWDKQRMGTGIQITEGDSRIFLREQAYMFRTAIATHGFEKGIGYWEIEADDRTEKEFKIGVSTCRDYDKDTAFCDFEFGWAYYGLAQLRHNSNATGPRFGKRFKNEGVLGVCLNMNNGTLKFSLNGELMGTAYQDEKLKIGPIYPAVSLLHCAGCRIITGKPSPQIFL